MDPHIPGGSAARPSWFARLGQALSNEPQDRDDLLAVLAEAEQRELIDADVLSIVEGAFEMGDLQARDAMIPRGQMVCVSRDQPISDSLPVMIESGHSRFPVIGEDKDDVLGLILAKDLLRLLVDGAGSVRIDDIMRPAVFIPESKRLNVLLREFRDSRNHMAVVFDEYGGVSGLITIEDVLEEIVGDIDDEHDSEEDAFIAKATDREGFTVAALTPIEVFNEHFHTALPDEEFDTIGGLIFGTAGRVPEPGETVQVGELEFDVLRGDSRRIHLLGLTDPPASASD